MLTIEQKEKKKTKTQRYDLDFFFFHLFSWIYMQILKKEKEKQDQRSDGTRKDTRFDLWLCCIRLFITFLIELLTRVKQTQTFINKFIIFKPIIEFNARTNNIYKENYHKRKQMKERILFTYIIKMKKNNK